MKHLELILDQLGDADEAVLTMRPEEAHIHILNAASLLEELMGEME